MLFAARVLAILMVAMMMPPPAHADDASALLERMRARIGPAWRAHLISTSLVTLNGDTVDMHTETENVRFASYECTENLCDGTYFDGERTYDININGTALPQLEASDQYLRGERTIASFAFLDPAFADDGGRVSDDGWVTVSGERYRSLVVANGDATPMQVFVDPAKAEVRYFRDVNGDSSFELQDYRPVDGGYVLPYLVLRNGKALERFRTRGSTSDTFTPPHGLRPAFHGPVKPIVTDPNHAAPIFACTLGGIATTCLLDSGNSGLAMSRELANQLSAATVGSFQIRGLGNYATDVVRGGSLDVGNATFPPANYVVLNDIHGLGYDVVLGADVFAATTVALDPVSHTIAFGAPLPGSATSVHIAFQDFLPVIPVQLGTVGTQLALDTGDESNINLAYDFYQEHHDLFSVTEQHNVNGVGGTSVEVMGTIPTVRIGDLSVLQQRIGATQTLRSTAFGHLGAGFLAHFNVVVDYASESVYLTPAPSE